jgi:fluoride exporter
MILVGIGGSLGAILRYLIGSLLGSRSNFPYATMLVNITGSFSLGFLAGNQYFDDWVRLFFGVGILGGFTTFSTFGYESITLLQRKQILQGILYIIASVGCSVAFAYLGFRL